MEVVQHQEQYRFGTNYKTTVKVTRVKLHLLDQSMSMIKVNTLLGSLHILCGSVVFVADFIANFKLTIIMIFFIVVDEVDACYDV